MMDPTYRTCVAVMSFAVVALAALLLMLSACDERQTHSPPDSSESSAEVKPDSKKPKPPPSKTFRICGKVFLDLACDGVRNPETDPGIANVTVALTDDDENLLDAVETNANGRFRFQNLPPGVYRVFVPTWSVSANPINQHLAEHFTLTTPVAGFHSVTLTKNDCTGNDFGFCPDPDPKLKGNGKSKGYWATNLRKAIEGQTHGVQVDAATLDLYLAEIEQLFLPEPYQWDANSREEAYAIFRKRPPSMFDNMLKQLLALAFNHVAGLGLQGADRELQALIILWGEALAAAYLADEPVSDNELETAKDLFEAINQTG